MIDRSKALAEEKVGKLLWKFSLPAIIGMLVNALYNVVDSIFVGRGVGEIGLTAVTISFPIMLILMAFGMLIGIGASTIISIRLGEQNKDRAEKTLGNALTLLIIIAVFLTGVSLLFLDPILIKLGATKDVLPHARAFARIILAGSIFMYLGFGLNNVIRAEGNPKIAMATMLISAILNTILNPIFIFGFKMGIAGSALATVIAQAVSAVWVLSYFLGKKSLLKIHYKNMRLELTIVKDIVKIGLSPFLMQIAASVVTVSFNINLLRYSGETAVAAMGIINRVLMLMIMPIFGISQGAQPIIGYNFGAKNFSRLTEALKKALLAATAVSTLAFIILELFATQIVSVFNKDPNLVSIGTVGLRIVIIMLPIIGFQIVGANYFQAVGKAGYAILFSMSRQVIILIPLIFILPHFFNLVGIWYAGPIADFASSLLTGTFVFLELRKLNRI